MEGMFTQKVHRGKIEVSAAGRAATCLKHGRLAPKLFNLFPFAFCLASVAFRQTPVLPQSVSYCQCEDSDDGLRMI